MRQVRAVTSWFLKGSSIGRAGWTVESDGADAEACKALERAAAGDVAEGPPGPGASSHLDTCAEKHPAGCSGLSGAAVPNCLRQECICLVRAFRSTSKRSCQMMCPVRKLVRWLCS
mmetsp:Transcript_105285/g.280332  ORF Transcript_105285/g.280332 Transcript_105285/m.280332 type:complete len:116 (-) Transcript_105285:145-492(-)